MQEPTVERFEQVMAALLRDYAVHDILHPAARLIFILESPHVQELKYGAPVSGPSGATMTRHLFGDDYAKFPLGRLVKKNVDDQVNRPRLSRIGLMNVCNVPLQSAAYPDPAVRQAYADWLRAMGTLRTSNQQDVYRDDAVNAVQAFLAASLRSKLLALTNRDCVFVPCGRFAQKFYRLAAVHRPNWTVIHGVPHPSYNAWDRAVYAPVIQRVQAALADVSREPLPS
ncbi:hypothetical protein JI721_08970 [Alicyclobacillus cycloheptanicus]|uniref:Membrane protein n=1 Tax=Alicyclobacillus cycloheptanicus TaxID=1457 RepID=A0ABT9XHD8_9BACL|nr:uracil-DNA glycosylase family protein [Alicyclobacillus cycloheptanicus]MDQ0189602.1 putative membrane protein [Alicyclobacillus cycloheptanicus]WDL99912.1 hypothetical protein JI721_08970 [Alicyclobacillus cycloheptanicus]